MEHSSEDYLDSLLRHAMGIPDPEPEQEPEPEPEPILEQEVESNEIILESEQSDATDLGLEDISLGDATTNIDATSFSSEKVNEFFADDAPFSEDFVYPEIGNDSSQGIEIPEGMELTDEGREILNEAFHDDMPIIEPADVDQPAIDLPGSDQVEFEDSSVETHMDAPVFEETGIDEPVVEEPAAPLISIDDLDPNDANKALDPDMIAALFASANADDSANAAEDTVSEDAPIEEPAVEASAEETVTEEPVVEEPVVEEPAAPSISIDDLDPNDANKALDPDMIAALFASANADDSANDASEDDATLIDAEEDASLDLGDDLSAGVDLEASDNSDVDSAELMPDEEISDLLSALDDLSNDNSEASSSSDAGADLGLGDIDFDNVDLGAMLDNVTSSVDDLSSEQDSFSDNDLSDLLNSIDGDKDISDINNLLSMDENSEIVDPSSSSSDAIFSFDAGEDDFSIDNLLDEDQETDKKKKKKKEKKPKKGKKNKGPVDDFADFGDGEAILDPNMIELEDRSDKEKKPGFFARLFAKLFEEVPDDDEQIKADGSLIEETAVEIAVEGAAVNDELLKEVNEEDDKKKKKKDKKKDKKKKNDSEGEGKDGEDSKKKKKKKKEKDSSEPEKPEKKLPRKKVAAIFGLCISLGIVLVVLAIFVPYSQDMKNANKYYASGEYDKVYEYLTGHKLNDEQQLLYDRSFTILKVQRQYESYLNYMKLGFKLEALNALVQGIQVADEFGSKAESLGVSDRFYSIANVIADELNNTFGVTLDEARAWYNLEGTPEYTKALYDKIFYSQPRDEEGNPVYVPKQDDNEVMMVEENDL